MAGGFKFTYGSALDCFRTLEEIHKLGLSLKFGEIDNNFGILFNQIVSRVLKEICDSNCFRPLPPMLGDGESIDLLRLYLCVREKGGYESVTKNGNWDLVAKEIGCDSNASASLKVVYVKYLELLDEWYCKNHKDKNLVNETSSLNDVEMKAVDSRKMFSDIEMKDYKELIDTGLKRVLDVKDLQSFVGSVEGIDIKDDVVIESGFDNKEENEASRKRKRERYLPLLDWVKRVSKDPGDLAIGPCPERSKWKVYGSDHVWKQVLSAREALLENANLDSKAKLIWQKNLKMHPAMYDDRSSRCSQRLISAKETRSSISSKKTTVQDLSESSSTGSRSDQEDEDSFYGYNIKRKRIPLGRQFQAKVPELTQQTYLFDSKWVEFSVWPLEKNETRSSLIELERIGKGRQDSCGCEFPGSLECVRFHISEKRNRTKLELGSAFYKWKFDNMGEKDVALKWTPDEEKKFEDIIKANPSSSGITFWDDLWTHFKDKKMAVLVGYYFNVYLLRRRAHQNRSDPSNIDSDDDELEKIGNEANNKVPGSIFCSPKKVNQNGR